ncbi:hypothetical protein CCH79_00020589, partial [Gambusia affinis]
SVDFKVHLQQFDLHFYRLKSLYNTAEVLGVGQRHFVLVQLGDEEKLPLTHISVDQTRWWEQEIFIGGPIQKGQLLTYNLTELIKPESYLVRLTPVTRYGDGDASERTITYSDQKEHQDDVFYITLIPTVEMKHKPSQKATYSTKTSSPTYNRLGVLAPSLLYQHSEHQLSCMPSPFLYCLYTHDYSPAHNNNHIVKFANNTTELVSPGDKAAYRKEVVKLKTTSLRTPRKPRSSALTQLLPTSMATSIETKLRLGEPLGHHCTVKRAKRAKHRKDWFTETDHEDTWVAPLPFKAPRPRLSNNREQATKRLTSLCHTLN